MFTSTRRGGAFKRTGDVFNTFIPVFHRRGKRNLHCELCRSVAQVSLTPWLVPDKARHKVGQL